MITMFDSTTVEQIPGDAPAVAGYVGGFWPDYGEDVKRWPHAKHLSIAINKGEDAECLDIEKGDATAADAPAWFHRQRDRGVDRPVFYASLSNMPVVEDELRRAGVSRAEYRVWDAHYTYEPHVSPGSDATQWTDKAMGRNLDQSLCRDTFFEVPSVPHVAEPHAVKLAPEKGRHQLALTSPEMRGENIRALQKALNERLEHYKSRIRVKENGIYDRETAHAVAVVARALGLEHYDGAPAVTRLIEHPNLRTPADRVREHARAKARLEVDAVAVRKDGTEEAIHGLARIPLVAAHFLGTHEEPANSNWGEPNPADWLKNFGFDSGAPWCAAFACSMVNLAGGAIHGGDPAFCPNLEAYARAGTNGFAEYRPSRDGMRPAIEPGWLALFNWDGGTEPQHVEIVKELGSSTVKCIGGNTGGPDPSWGGMVAEEERAYSLIVGYCRPRI